MYTLKYNIHNIYFELRNKNWISTYLADKQSYSNYLTDQTPFILLKNLRKNNGKFRYLLKNIVAEKNFLVYAYKATAVIPSYNIHIDFIDKAITKESIMAGLPGGLLLNIPKEIIQDIRQVTDEIIENFDTVQKINWNGSLRNL